MFVPVSCTNCGKPFQVPESALGQRTLCPWCQAVVTALPVAAPVAPAPEQPAPEPPERDIPVAKIVLPPQPLSLDDAPAKARPVHPPAPPAPRAWFSPITIVIGMVVVIAVTVLTMAVLGFRSGRVFEAGWTEFTPPDGSCAVLLPGPPGEEDVDANPAGSVTGGKRYEARGWYSGTSAWLAWNDLEPGFAASALKDKSKVFTASAIQSELNREKARLEGTVTKEVEVRFNAAWGVEVHMDTPRGKVVEWLLVAPDGARPRLYVYGLRAKNIAPDSAVVRRMFTSFKVNE